MFDVANNKEFLTEIGIANAPEDVKAKLIAGIEDLAKKRLIIKLSERLTDAEAEEFGAITDEQQAYNWLMAKVPDLQNIVVEIFAEIKRDILEHKANVADQNPVQ